MCSILACRPSNLAHPVDSGRTPQSGQAQQGVLSCQLYVGTVTGPNLKAGAAKGCVGQRIRVWVRVIGTWPSPRRVQAQLPAADSECRAPADGDPGMGPRKCALRMPRLLHTGARRY